MTSTCAKHTPTYVIVFSFQGFQTNIIVVKVYDSCYLVISIDNFNFIGKIRMVHSEYGMTKLCSRTGVDIRIVSSNVIVSYWTESFRLFVAFRLNIEINWFCWYHDHVSKNLPAKTRSQSITWFW